MREAGVRRLARIACGAAVAVAVTISLPQPAHADNLTPPPVPDKLDVPAGHSLFFAGHAFGTQNYICLPSGAGFAWSLFTPQATLFDGGRRQLTTHFFSPNPFEPGNPIRATWQHSVDTSSVWAKVAPDGLSTDERFVAPGAIPWLLLEAVGPLDGRPEDGRLSITTFVQRLNTLGGSAPSSGCAQSADVGSKAFVPYEADYFFYTDRQPPEGN